MAEGKNLYGSTSLTDIANGANGVQGLSDILWGANKTEQLSTLTPEQQDLLKQNIGLASGSMDNLYGGFESLFNAPRDSYQALPDFNQTFNDMYGNPMAQQYEKDLANIANSNELHSGGNTAQNFRAMSQFNAGLASARANMMMQERAKQQQAAESSYGRQLQAGQILGALSSQALTTRGFENMTSRDGGLFSGLANAGQIANAGAQAATGFAALGGGASASQIAGSQGFKDSLTGAAAGAVGLPLAK